jgi:P-type conjugative transfer protein TrbG
LSKTLVGQKKFEKQESPMMKKNIVHATLFSLLICSALALAAERQNPLFSPLGVAGQDGVSASVKPTTTVVVSPSPTPKESLSFVSSKQPDKFVVTTRRSANPYNAAVQSKTRNNIRKNTQDITDAMANQADFVYTYIDNGIYRIYCKEQRLTDIQLQVGETILFIGGGDTARWQVDTDISGTGEVQQSHIYIKPLRDDIATNLIINTNRHNYHCEIIAGHAFSPIISWVYPKEKGNILRGRSLTEQAEFEVAGNMDYTAMNFNYKVKGKDYHWKPKMVFSDQIHVYIQMPATMQSDEAPVLFIKDDRKLQLVNYRVRGDYYIVDRLFEEAELRCGTKSVIIKRTRDNR